MKELRASRTIALFGALPWILIVLLSGGPVRADEDEATVDMARERFKEGVAYFDKKQYDKARAAFLQAYALKKHPAVLLNLAQSELRSGYEVDAAQHFQRYLREANEATPAERQSAEAGLASARPSVVELTIAVDEPGAEIYVDGNLEGKSPLNDPVFVAKGRHRLEARKDGNSARAELNSSSRSAWVTLKFKKAAPAAEQQESSPHEPGREPFFRWLTHSPVGLVGIGLTGIGVGSGIGFAIGAKHADDNANGILGSISNQLTTDTGVMDIPCPDPAAWAASTGHPLTPTQIGDYSEACKRYQDDIDLRNKQRTLSVVGFAVAGAAVVGTVVIYLLDGHSSADEARSSGRGRALLVPMLGPHERGLSLVGSF